MRFRAIALPAGIAAALLSATPGRAGDKVHGSGKTISVKQQGSGQVSMYPEVNDSPAADRIIPIPYPDIGESKDAAQTPKKTKTGRKPTNPSGEVQKETGKAVETKTGVSSGPATTEQQPGASLDKWEQPARKKWSFGPSWKNSRKASDDLQRARSHLDSGRARQTLRVLADIDVNSLDAKRRGAFYSIRAAAKGKSGDRGGAYDDYKKLAEDAPDDTDILYLYGQAALRTGRTTEAASALRKASYLDPLDPGKRRLYRKALEQEGTPTLPPGQFGRKATGKGGSGDSQGDE